MGIWDSIKKYAPYAAGVPLTTDQIKRGLGGLTAESQSTKDQRAAMEGQAGASGAFADQAQQGYGALGAEATAAREALRARAEGRAPSLSAEQLRQGLQQNVSAQRSMAAGAAPNNAVMAARTAAIQSARLGSGMAGQAALAGIQEREAAQRALDESIARQQAMALQAALGGRSTAIQGYGGVKPEGSLLDRYGPVIQAGIGAAGVAAKSDERAKRNIRPADDEAKQILAGLKSYRYDYKDERDGKGRQFGPMAQDLEKAGLGHAVMDTPEGKMVHGSKLALSATALVAALGRRVSKLEEGR